MRFKRVNSGRKQKLLTCVGHRRGGQKYGFIFILILQSTTKTNFAKLGRVDRVCVQHKQT